MLHYIDFPKHDLSLEILDKQSDMMFQYLFSSDVRIFIMLIIVAIFAIISFFEVISLNLELRKMKNDIDKKSLLFRFSNLLDKYSMVFLFVILIMFCLSFVNYLQSEADNYNKHAEQYLSEQKSKQ